MQRYSPHALRQAQRLEIGSPKHPTPACHVCDKDELKYMPLSRIQYHQHARKPGVLIAHVPIGGLTSVLHQIIERQPAIHHRKQDIAYGAIVRKHIVVRSYLSNYTELTVM